MINFFREIFKPKYETLNKIEIDAKKIIANFNYLKERQKDAEIFPVLKSNAYGHGLKEMCKIINKTSAPLVIVDSFPEAQIAYKYFKRKVLILGEMPIKTYNYCNFKKTEFIVYNDKTLRYLSRWGKKIKIHLFVNSGMNREGIKDIKEFIDINREFLDKVDVVGLCSHLASAEDRSVLNQVQEESFFNSLEILRQASFFPRWVHLGNSAGLLTLNNNLLTAYRPGLAIYGYNPLLAEDAEFDHDLPLQPALKAVSKVISVQRILANEPVSYNESYRAGSDTNIAVIPYGYFEGLDRRLSNKAEFYISNIESSFWAPIAGRVCMNLTCLDAGNKNIQKGDEVIIISDDKENRNSIVNLARIMETVPYEFLVKLQPSVRREIIW